MTAKKRALYYSTPKSIHALIKCNLGSLLAHVDVLEKGAVLGVGLLLDRGAKLEQVFGDLLVRALENVDEPGVMVNMCALKRSRAVGLTIQSASYRAR